MLNASCLIFTTLLLSFFYVSFLITPRQIISLHFHTMTFVGKPFQESFGALSNTTRVTKCLLGRVLSLQTLHIWAPAIVSSLSAFGGPYWVGPLTNCPHCLLPSSFSPFSLKAVKKGHQVQQSKTKDHRYSHLNISRKLTINLFGHRHNE